jgi:ubiquinone/menaquinone biosynthesis C-methylase UbiE
MARLMQKVIKGGEKMNTEFIDILRCPLCGGVLSLIGPKRSTHIDSGEIICTACGKRFPVKDGITRFIESDDMSEEERRFELFRRLFYSRIYDSSTRLMFLLCGGEDKARSECLDRLEITQRSRILETGIGTASNVPYLLKKIGKCNIFGIDISPSMLRLSERKLKRFGFAPEIFQARAEHLPFKDNSFDSVFHIGAINIFENKKQAIDEMIRVARPGTKIIIADESDKTNKLWDKLLFTRLLSRQTEVVPPIDLVPRNMTDIKLDTIWKGYGYCIEFKTPVRRYNEEKQTQSSESKGSRAVPVQ